jgi:tetraacyldisaccharide 4'-kinase
LWLAAFLRARGLTPGIVCRGYGGRSRSPQRVAPKSDPLVVGDEAVLLARRGCCEVWAGADRAAAALALLGAQPPCDVVISDDGLQHYALARDLEICVVDGGRGFGNGWLLPAGPLREPRSRLAQVDTIVVNHDFRGEPHPTLAGLPDDIPRVNMRVEGREFRNLANPAQRVGPEHFRGKTVHAVAGIGNPQRFFSLLRLFGLDITTRPFPDHHPFTASDLAYAGTNTVLMTEKDAVKCQRFARESYWELAVDAVPGPALGAEVLRGLERKTNKQDPEG